jgi:hypothetical protein
MDLFGLLYLFFRLSPFIIASFFSLISVFNSDLKGFIYLVGLIFSTAITMFAGNSAKSTFFPDFGTGTTTTSSDKSGASGASGSKSTSATSASKSSGVVDAALSLFGGGGDGDLKQTKGEIPPVCNTLSLGGFTGFSKVPLSTAVLSYTFFYLVYTIGKYDMALYNIPTLILFPILILSDMGWNIKNGCYPLIACVMSLIVAGGIGVLWSFIVSTYMPNMQYIIVGSNREMCMKPNDQTMICTED